MHSSGFTRILMSLVGVTLLSGCGMSVSKAMTRLSDPDPLKRQEAVLALTGRGQETYSQVHQVLLHDEQNFVRASAARALVQSGEVAWAADGLKDRDELVRGQTAYVLGRYGGPEAPPYLLPAMAEEKNQTVRGFFIEASLRQRTRDFIPCLGRYLDSPEEEIRVRAMVALGVISEKGLALDVKRWKAWLNENYPATPVAPATPASPAVVPSPAAAPPSATP